MPYWKAPSHDGIHGFWFLKFTSIHDRLAIKMNRCLEETDISEWMTKGKITLIQKDSQKEITQNNYRPVTWKILMAEIKVEIYYLLIKHGPFYAEQKGCCKGTRGDTIYWLTHPGKVLNEMEKYSYDVDWLQKGIQYSPAKCTRYPAVISLSRKSWKTEEWNWQQKKKA